MGRSTPATFGQLIRHYRGAAGLTQDALAERAGVSTRAVAYLERDLRAPFPDTVHRLAGALRLSETDLSTLLAATRAHPGELADAVPVPVAELPRPLTSLIGRDQDVAQVRALLGRPGVRLVTLTGTGGVGKTRLAIQVATEAAGSFADGARFVGLAGVREPGLVVPAIAQALEVREVGDAPLGVRLADYLRERRILLLLDNFEQVGAAAPEVATLLAACSGLVVLVTSRASLRVQGEHEWPVLPLAVPAPKQALTLEELGRLSAVALFVQRGQAIKPDFALTEANAPGIAAICRELDGLPLALELAAARLKVLSPGALLSRIARRLVLLTGGALDLPERQRTLRGAIAWSYELLEPDEQVLLRRLAVFSGGAGLEAVETVCGREEAADEAMVDGLSALIDQSLVQVSVGGDAGEPRYGLLETVREYGLEQLEAAGEAAAVRDRHLAWCLALAEAVAGASPGPEQSAALERLEAERDNFQGALTWSAGTGAGGAGSRPEQMLRLATALAPFWEARGPLSEGRRRLEAALATGAAVPIGMRLPALAAAGRLAGHQGDETAAQHWVGESLDGFRAVGDRLGMATALTTLGQAMSLAGPAERAVGLFEEALSLCRDLGDKAGIARALNGLAYAATERGESAAATAFLEESLSMQRDLGDAPGSAQTLLRLGECFLDQGDTARAIQLFDEHLAQARALGDTITIASALLTRGEAAMRRGEFADAEALMAESLALSRKVDATGWMEGALSRSTVLATWQGHYEQAFARLEECITLRRPSGENANNPDTLCTLAWITGCQGEHERAVLLAEKSLEIVRDTGCGSTAWALLVLGGAVVASGNETRAYPLFQESLSLIRDCLTANHGRTTWFDKLMIVNNLTGMAQVAASRGQSERAVVLYGASEVCRATAPFPLAPPEEDARDRVLAAAWTALGEAAFAAAWAAGQAMRVDEAIALALEDGDAAIL